MSSVGSGVSESATSYQQQQQTNNAQQQYPSRLPGVRKRVSQLLRHRRQREPLIVEEDTTIRQVCEQMASTRNSAFLMVTLVNGVKRVSGIGTDVDVCKSVSHDLDPETTKVSEIMTPWPKSVEPSDEAQIAFKMMVGNRFRHLPVIKRDGSCAGLIDIAQCLYDGIAQLESIQRAQASFMDAVKQTRLRWLQVGLNLSDMSCRLETNASQQSVASNQKSAWVCLSSYAYDCCACD
jgi:signal-transduction protein with cAMP-binding, CBS, and nucleotidyltransferase domain